jgi:hypothetical protein
MSENIKKREQRLAARDARRLAQRAATLQPVVVYPSKSTNWISVAIGAGGTAVYLTLGAWSYSAATVDDMIGAGILLVLAFLVAVAALMASERYGGFANRSRLFLNLVFAGVMAAISCLLFWWEYAHRPTPAATADEIKKIIQNLPPAAPKADGSRRPAFEANTGGTIDADGAVIPGDLPFPFVRSESGASVSMRGAKIFNNRTDPDAGQLSVRDLPLLMATGQPKYGFFLVVFNPVIGDKTGPWEVSSVSVPGATVALFGSQTSEEEQVAKAVFTNEVKNAGNFHSRYYPTPTFVRIWINPTSRDAFIKEPKLDLVLSAPNGQSFRQVIPIKLMNLN